MEQAADVYENEWGCTLPSGWSRSSGPYSATLNDGPV